MARIYADMIISKANGGTGVTFDQVPASRKADVEAELNSRGYGTDGQKLITEEQTTPQ